MNALHHALSQLEMFQQELCSEFLSLKTSPGFINMGFFFGVMWSLTFIKLTSGIDKSCSSYSQTPLKLETAFSPRSAPH